MAEEDIILEKTIAYEGVMDFKEVYELLSSTFGTLGYNIAEEKQVLKSKGAKRTHEAEWVCTRNVDQYTLFQIKLSISATVSDIDVSEEGVAVRRESGSLKLKFKGSLITDYANKWEGSPYYKVMKNFFDKFLYGKGRSASLAKGTYKQWIGKVSDDFETVIGEVKALLHLYKV